MRKAADTAHEEARFRYVLRLADTSLVLGQRLGEWLGHAPALEEDLAHCRRRTQRFFTSSGMA